MPNYAYGCSTCGHDFELVQRMTDAPIRECPNCNCDTAVRKVFAPSLVLGAAVDAPTGNPRATGPRRAAPNELFTTEKSPA